MCGRYTIPSTDVILARVAAAGLKLAEPDSLLWDLPPRYNMAPTQDAPVILNLKEPTLDVLRWGLVPRWAKEPFIGNRMINARAETAAEKPAYRDAFRRRHCLVPASGFYEWQAAGKGPKQPYHFRPPDGQVLMIAGLWEEWQDRESGQRLRTYTLLTGAPNEVVQPVHDRMPVILPVERWEAWIDPAERPAKQVQELLGVYPAEGLEAVAVSRAVNSPGVDLPELIEPTE